MKKNEIYFSKKETKIIKGLAIILMLMHHLWSFPNRIPGGELKYFFTIGGKSSLMFFGLFGKICVSIFFFVGGYSIYKMSQKKDFNIFNNFKKLYINYWKVFLIFIPIGFLFFRHQIAYCNEASVYSKFSNYNVFNIINNFLGLSSSLNNEWWFFYSYLMALITFPFIKRIFENKSTAINIFIVIVYSLLVTDVFPAIGNIESIGMLNNNMIYKTLFLQTGPYIASFWFGALFAKDDLLFKLKNKINEVIPLNVFVDIIGIIVIIYVREIIFGSVYDMVYIPFLIVFFLDFVSKFKLLEKLFEFLGIHSTNIWLIHSFFCYYFYFFVRIVIYLEWGVPCLLTLLILSIIASCRVNDFWDWVNKVFLSIKSNILKH